MFWLIAIAIPTAVLSAFIGFTFWCVARAMRNTNEISDVIQLGIAALALLLGTAILPWQFADSIKVVDRDHVVAAGLWLMIGFIVFAIAYMAFLAYYLPKHQAVPDEQWFHRCCYWLSFLFYVAGAIWCAVVSWLLVVLVLQLLA